MTEDGGRGKRRFAAAALITVSIGLTMASPTARSEVLLRTNLSGIATHELLVWTNDFPAGSATDLHHHAGHEVLYVLSGEVKVRIGDRDQVYREGAVIQVPAGSSMRVSNVSANPAKTLVYMLKKKGTPLSIKGSK